MKSDTLETLAILNRWLTMVNLLSFLLKTTKSLYLGNIMLLVEVVFVMLTRMTLAGMATLTVSPLDMLVLGLPVGSLLLVLSSELYTYTHTHLYTIIYIYIYTIICIYYYIYVYIYLPCSPWR